MATGFLCNFKLQATVDHALNKRRRKMQEQAVMFIYTAGRKVNMIEHNGNEET